MVAMERLTKPLHYGPDHMGRQFAYYFPVSASDDHQVNAFIDDPFGRMHMGSLRWNQEGEITGVYVPKRLRRRGIATAMFKIAHEVAEGMEDMNPPEHAADRTPEGDAWAKAVGGVIPPLRTSLPSQ